MPARRKATLRPKWALQRKLVLAATGVFISVPAMCGTFTSGSQLSVMTGDVMGSYNVSSLHQTFSVPTTVDGTYEMFTSSKRSLFLRTTLSYQLATSQLMYAYVGSGFNFYLGGGAMEFDQDDGHDQVSYVPHRRYFVGTDYGVSQVVLKPISDALSITGGMIDFGAHVGIIQSIGKNLGIEGLVGLSYGLGFTQVSAAGTTLRILVGLTQYF